MNKFTELVKQWRKRAYPLNDGISALTCADDLESLIAKHMTWVQITEDESTWPDENQRHMIWYTDDYVTHIEDWSNRHYKLYLSDWYRPLNDNDYPPQEVK